MFRFLLFCCCYYSCTLVAQDFQPTTIVCQDGPFTLSSPLTDGQTYVYRWERSFDGGNSWSATGSDSPDLTISRPNPGIRYRLVYAVDATCLADAACRQMTGATELTIQIPTFSQGLTRCAGDTLFVGATPITTAGNHRTGLTTAAGCDSIVLTFLQILPAQDQLFFVDLCPGEVFNGQTFTRDTLLVETFTNTAGCDSTNRYEINVNLDDVASLVVDGPTSVCSGDGEVYLTAPGQFQRYVWSTGATTASIAAPTSGTYGLTMTNFSGCTVELTHELTIVDLQVDEVRPISPACPGTETGQISITASGDSDLLYSIDGGESFWLEAEFNNLAPGSYDIMVESADGCTASATTEITAAPALNLTTSLPSEQMIERGDSLPLAVVADFSVMEWQWSPARWVTKADSATTMAYPVVDTEFYLEAKAAGGCSVRDTILITVKDSRRFYAPTAFSPNGDAGAVCGTPSKKRNSHRLKLVGTALKTAPQCPLVLISIRPPSATRTARYAPSRGR